MLAKIGTFILDYVLKRFWSWLSAFWKQDQKVDKQNVEAEKSADEFQKVVVDPTKSREDRKRAEDTFLNS
jgi:hypothetical protein